MIRSELAPYVELRPCVGPAAHDKLQDLSCTRLALGARDKIACFVAVLVFVLRWVQQCVEVLAGLLTALGLQSGQGQMGCHENGRDRTSQIHPVQDFHTPTAEMG